MTGSIRSGRHLGLLTLAVLVLAVAAPWRQVGALPNAGLYGSLHAALLVLCVRQPVTLARRLGFIAAAGCLSVASLAVAFEFSHLAAAISFAGKPSVALGVFAGVGACSYGMLIRHLRIAGLGGRALALSVLVCVLSTEIAFNLAPLAQARSGLGLAAVWWFGFSAVLLYYDRRRNPLI